MTMSRGVEFFVESLGMTTAFRYVRFLVSTCLFFKRFHIFEHTSLNS